MTIEEFNKAKEKELRSMWDSSNEFKVKGKILGILEELEKAKQYWKRRYDEGGVADTRLDIFDSRDNGIADVALDEEEWLF